MLRRLAPVLLILSVAASDLVAQGLTPEALVSMERMSDPQVSPDGSLVVFVRRRTDLDANKGRTDLWLLDLSSGGPRRLTEDPASDHSPRWSPTGDAIYFLSSRSGSSQIWRLALAGGEALQITKAPIGVSNLVVAPAGNKVAFTASVFPDCASLSCTADRLGRAEEKPTGRVYDRLLARHWDSWSDGRQSHLFVQSTRGGEPIDLTRRLNANVPSQPFGGAEEIAFTPDGSGLVFVSRRADEEEAWSTNFDLYLVSSDGEGAPSILTEENPAWDTGPVFSPDGSTLAYLAMSRAGYESDRFRVVLRDWDSGRERTLTEEWDRSVSSMTYSADGRTLFVTAQDTGEVPLFSIDVETGEVTELVRGGHVRSPGVVADGLIYGMDSLTSPVDLYWTDFEGRRQKRLTRINARRLSGVEMGEPEQIAFEGWNGETVHAWIVKPVGFSPDESYPVAFLIHGGPQGSFDNDFHYRWNPQVYAGAGYAAVMVDFHGSTGYGQDFTDSIAGDWGGKPLVDLQLGLAAALDANPWMDEDRVCGLGASYGGYMVNWIAGNWSSAFQCLINHDGIFDQRMMYYATEELWFPEWEHGGPYWRSASSFERHNPANTVDRWDTPMLVIQGALDYRVPETQSLATFTALQRQGIPSRLLHYPDENHWVLKPRNSIQWHEEVLSWMGTWVGE